MIAGTPLRPSASPAATIADYGSGTPLQSHGDRPRPGPAATGAGGAFLGMAAAIPFGGRSHHFGTTPIHCGGCQGASCPRFSDLAGLRAAPV